MQIPITKPQNNTKASPILSLELPAPEELFHD